MISFFKKKDTRPKIQKLGDLLQQAIVKDEKVGAKKRKKYLKNMMDIIGEEKNTHYADMVAKAAQLAVFLTEKNQGRRKAAILAGDLFEYAQKMTTKNKNNCVEEALDKIDNVFNPK